MSYVGYLQEPKAEFITPVYFKTSERRGQSRQVGINIQ